MEKILKIISEGYKLIEEPRNYFIISGVYGVVEKLIGQY
jgi:hypothetical protein